MIDAMIDDEEIDDEEIDDETPVPDASASERWIRKRIGRRDSTPTAMAFVFTGRDRHLAYPVTVASWSNAGISLLHQIDQALKAQHPSVHLPVVSLRSRIELEDAGNLRLDRDLGRGWRGRTILWTETAVPEARTAANTVVLRWLVNDVGRLLRTEDAQGALDQLKQLAQTQRAVEVSTRKATPFDWRQTLGKTAKGTSETSYPDLADVIARHLAGKVVFPGLQGLRRIAVGDLSKNQAELITDPESFGKDDRFSLVIRVRVFSFPGRPTPVIVIEFAKRMWTSGLKASGTSKTVRGYAFPDVGVRAFPFTLVSKRQDDRKYRFELDADFWPIRQRYLPRVDKVSTDWIFQEGHSAEGCKVFVGLKHGTGTKSKTSGGIPDLDKMEGFRAIRAILAEIGLQPWQGIEVVETSTRSSKDRDQHWRNSAREKKPQKYAAWLQEAQASLRACYAGEHHVVLAVQPGHGVERDADLAEKELTVTLQGSVHVQRIPIPADVHGPRAQLPGSDIKAAHERAALRIKAWQPFIDIVKEYEATTGRRIDGVLVLAHKWYVGNQPDDQVNKRAARMALARGLGVPVQYLLPRHGELADSGEAGQGAKPSSEHRIKKDTEKFQHRLMIAWLDLAYKSLGRVRPGKLVSEASKLYKGAQGNRFGNYPDRILALGIVRRNERARLRNERSFLPFAIELDVETGTCTASFAYQDATTEKVTRSDPLPLPQALVKLARLGPVDLSSAAGGDRTRELGERTQAFFKERIADLMKRGLKPLVIVDADSARSYWQWLKDDEIDPGNMQLAGGFNALAAWPKLRLVRVRTSNSPKVLWGNTYEGVVETTGEVVTYEGPKWADAQLFKLTDTVRTDVYLSFGSIIRTGQTKGQSCYRQMPGMRTCFNREKRGYVAGDMKRFAEGWTTPQGVEIFVVRPGDDDPDQIARLVEWLRQCYAHYGDWSIKPAPLFFEGVLKEYISDYGLDESEDGAEAEEQAEADEGGETEEQ